MVDSVLEVQNIKTTGISPQKDIVTTNSGTGDVTVNGNIVVPDSGTIGSASDTDAITIDNSGNVLVGKTGTGIGTVGAELKPTGELVATVSGDACVSLNRTSSDGEIVQFHKDGTMFGSIGNSGGSLIVAATQSGYGQLRSLSNTGYAWYTNGATAGGSFYPTDDNKRDLGEPSLRFDDVYATNGTIQTSDRNEKQDIEKLSEAEQRVAVAAKGLLRKYRWKSAVVEKGDKARIHFGIIAQDLKAAFEAESLDAGRYAMFIHSTWWESEETYTDDNGVEQTRINTFDTEEEAPEGAIKKDRMGVRYSELLAFIIAAI